MSKFLNTTQKTISALKSLSDNDLLSMKPPFQRNLVWTHAQKSYLIDSVLNGFPIPEIYMQYEVDHEGTENHIVVDGQQRINACLEFIAGEFEIKEEESPSWGDMKFDDLSPEDKKKIFGYTFIVRTLPEMSDEEIRGIFQRLNKNVTALNRQELRQATYWGPFIKTMQKIADFSYWGTTGIFTPLNIRRMLDVEYISELSVAILHGHQNKKTRLDNYYRQYEEEFDYSEDLINTFKTVIYELEQILPDIKNTRWRKKTDFYSLFVCLANKEKVLPFNDSQKKRIREILFKFEEQINGYLSTGGENTKNNISKEAEKYSKSIRASSDLSNRKRRHEALLEVLARALDVEGNPKNRIEIRPLPEKDLFSSQE